MTFKLLQVTGIALTLSLILILPTATVNAFPHMANIDDPTHTTPSIVRLSPTEDLRGRDISPHGQMCDYGRTDDLLWTLIDGGNNTITLWCKRVPVHTQTGDMIPPTGILTTRQFVGYYNSVYIIGFCPFDKGMNSWHWDFGKNNILTHSEWISRALNGTTVTFGFSWNTTAPTTP